MLVGLILLCVACILLSAPGPAPWSNWAAFILSLVALLIIVLRHQGPIW